MKGHNYKQLFASFCINKDVHYSITIKILCHEKESNHY
jgi:hypothetical protein